MGEENRGSSGGGTAMIVVAILGGILLVGCCGGVVAVGLGGALAWNRSVPDHMQAQPPMSAPMPVQVDPQVTKALDELNKDMEAPGIEGVPPAPTLEDKQE